MIRPSSQSTSEDRSRWEPVVDMMSGSRPISMGPMHAYQMRHTPRRILYTASYYKFAAKMIHRPLEQDTLDTDTQSHHILDIGCGEGIGTWMLAKECGGAHGVDIDQDLIQIARQNWTMTKEATGQDGQDGQKASPPISFSCEDFLASTPDTNRLFDGVVSMDVIEHIRPENAEQFIQNIANHLKDHGVAVIGTPNITSRPYASEITNRGHVNMYSGESLQAAFEQSFQHVFTFAANDEIIHTGFFPMAHYLITVGCGPLKR